MSLPGSSASRSSGSNGASATPGAGVLDFMRHRLERALRQRVRYRYVKPRVLREGDGLRIESPCCSRNVDAQGGVIDIALLLPVGGDEHQGSGQAAQLWRLFARDHAAGGWVLQHESERIDDLVQLLCTDARRVYWP